MVVEKGIFAFGIMGKAGLMQVRFKEGGGGGGPARFFGGNSPRY